METGGTPVLRGIRHRKTFRRALRVGATQLIFSRCFWPVKPELKKDFRFCSGGAAAPPCLVLAGWPEKETKKARLVSQSGNFCRVILYHFKDCDTSHEFIVVASVLNTLAANFTRGFPRVVVCRRPIRPRLRRLPPERQLSRCSLSTRLRWLRSPKRSPYRRGRCPRD